MAAWHASTKLPRPHDLDSLRADLQESAQDLRTFGACGPTSLELVSEFLRVLPRSAGHDKFRALESVARQLDQVLIDEEASVLLLTQGLSPSGPDLSGAVDWYRWARQLESLLLQRRLEPEWVLSSVSRVLNDDAIEIKGLEAIEAGASSRAMGGEPAGTSPEERIALACDRLRTDPGKHQIVVWLYFDNAQDSEFKREIGPVTFYDGRWWESVVDDPHSDLLPPEIRGGHALLRGHEGEDRFVLARVDLGERELVESVQIARDNVAAVANLARFWGTSTWELWEGHVLFIGGQDSGFAAFHAPGRAPWGLSPMVDQTDETLERVREALEAHLPVEDSEMRDLFGLIDTLNSSARTHPAVRLLTSVRAIEHVASRRDGGSLRWYDFLDSYRAAWSIWSLGNEFFDIAYRAIQALRWDSKYSEQAARLIENNGPHSFSLRVERVCAEMPNLHDRLGPDWENTLRLGDMVSMVSNSPKAAEYADHIASDHDHLVRRARRIRNAIMHGGGVEIAALTTVDGFMRRLAIQVIHDALRARLTGTPVSDYVETSDEYYRTMVEDLHNGLPFHEVMTRSRPET